MSRFSGKCDLYDCIEICGGFEEFKKKYKNIYVGKSGEPLHIETMKDIIPYYPYVVSMSSGNTMHLTSKSWVDMEEEKSLEFYLMHLLKYYKKCKREKKEFDIDLACRYIDDFCPSDISRKLAIRINENGSKATTEGLHLDCYKHYRKNLRKEMELYSNVSFYNKLVRDKIPDIINNKGQRAVTKILSKNELIDLLYEKLSEETKELVKDRNEEEIADVLEVIDCIISTNGFSREKIEEIKEKKNEERGSFRNGVFLEKVEL